MHIIRGKIGNPDDSDESPEKENPYEGPVDAEPEINIRINDEEPEHRFEVDKEPTNKEVKNFQAEEPKSQKKTSYLSWTPKLRPLSNSKPAPSSISNKNYDSKGMSSDGYSAGLKKYIKTRFLVFSLFWILFLAISLVLMKDRHRDSPSKRVISQIAKTMGQPPIEDIKVVDSDKGCGAGWEEIQLGEWRGSAEGCYCEQYSKAEVVFRESCEISEINEKPCHKIKKSKKKKLYVWKNRKFCVKRYSEVSIPNLLGECGNGLKLCKDTCVPKNRECPISELKFDGDEITRANNELAIASLTIGNYRMACLTEYDLFLTGLIYPLLNVRFDECFYGYYKYSMKLDQESNLEIYKQNGLGKVIDSFPFYEDIGNETLYLVGLRRWEVRFDDFCRKQEVYNDIFKLNKAMDSSERTQDAYAKMTYGFMFAFLAVIIFQAYCLLRGKLENILYIRLQMYSNIPLALFNLAVIVSYFVGTKDIGFIKDQESNIEMLYAKECFEEEAVHDALKDYRSIVMGAMHSYWNKALVLNILSFILFIYFVAEGTILKRKINRL
jgi:hypothetical protein